MIQKINSLYARQYSVCGGVSRQARETWVSDCPDPLCGCGQLTELPWVFFPYFTDVGNSTTG